ESVCVSPCVFRSRMFVLRAPCQTIWHCPLSALRRPGSTRNHKDSRVSLTYEPASTYVLAVAIYDTRQRVAYICSSPQHSSSQSSSTYTPLTGVLTNPSFFIRFSSFSPIPSTALSCLRLEWGLSCR